MTTEDLLRPQATRKPILVPHGDGSSTLLIRPIGTWHPTPLPRRHTVGHMCYYATDGDQRVVFTGDTLFIGGAGRLFEGSAAELQESLAVKLGKLPGDTLVYCGHEVGTPGDSSGIRLTVGARSVSQLPPT